MKCKSTIPLAVLFAAFLFSCDFTEPEEEEELLVVPTPGSINGHFELGRALFYDKQLSADHTTSCGSCHKQEFGFADNISFSSGVDGKVTKRNTMPIQNLSMEPHFGFDTTKMVEDTIPTPLFWDGREEDLFKMVLMPFTEKNEHGLEDLSMLVNKVNSLPYYQEAFRDAFGIEKINEELIAMALASFVVSIQTSSTRLDEFMVSGAGLTSLEMQGRDLFFEKYDCNACHQVQSTSGYLQVNISDGSGGFSNIGLDLVPPDQGRMLATGNPRDAGKFKIPSLRNVALTAPYMHDGRIQSLDSVIEHYSTGLSDDPNLDTLLQDDQGEPLQLNITNEERIALVAFLKTLTDDKIVNDPAFSDPFEQ